MTRLKTPVKKYTPPYIARLQRLCVQEGRNPGSLPFVPQRTNGRTAACSAPVKQPQRVYTSQHTRLQNSKEMVRYSCSVIRLSFAFFTTHFGNPLVHARELLLEGFL